MLKYFASLLILVCFSSTAVTSEPHKTHCKTEADILTYAPVGENGSFLELCYHAGDKEVYYYTDNYRGKVTETVLPLEKVQYVKIPGKHNELSGYILSTDEVETFITKAHISDERHAEIQYWNQSGLIGVKSLDPLKVFMRADSAFTEKKELP